MFVKELLSERKQVGTLYHFTSFNSLLSLVKSNFTFNTRNGFLSLTRDYQLPRSVGYDTTFASSTVRIAVDGNRISDKYKITPLLGLKNPNDSDIYAKHADRIDRVIDSESESVLHNKSKSVNIKNYVLQVEIITTGPYQEVYDTLKPYFDSNNIPFRCQRIFNKFKLNEDEVLDTSLYYLT